VGEPTLEDPKRTLAPDVNRQNMVILADAINACRPAAPSAGTITPTAPNEPPRSDQPNSAPLQMPSSAGGTGVGVQVVSAPSGSDPNAVLNAVGPANTAVPEAEKPASAPDQVNEIKPGQVPAAATTKSKKPRADLSDESSSKKKKKKGLKKIDPF
jgi:outer membrane protein assembly factor BamD